MNLLVLGPQGSGKGTQATVIAAAHGIPHVSTGDMFRGAIAAESPLGLRVKEIVESGGLVPDELTTELVQERLSAPDASGGFVLDGYPRNLGQARALAGWLDDVGRSLDAALFFELSDEIATERALGRAAATGRTDDTPEVIARRLELYHTETEPVIDFYRAAGLLVTLRAELPIAEVSEEIEAALTGIGGGRAA